MLCNLHSSISTIHIWFNVIFKVNNCPCIAKPAVRQAMYITVEHRPQRTIKTGRAKQQLCAIKDALFHVWCVVFLALNCWPPSAPDFITFSTPSMVERGRESRRERDKVNTVQWREIHNPSIHHNHWSNPCLSLSQVKIKTFLPSESERDLDEISKSYI